MKKYISIILMLVMLVSLAACGGKEESTTAASGENTEKPEVISTVFPTYDFARQIGGDKINVKMLIAPGAEVHGFEATLADQAAITSCDLFLYCGGESDDWVKYFFASLSDGDKKFKSLAMVDCEGIKLLEESDAGMLINDEEEPASGEEGEGHANDEHVWTSVENAKAISKAICAELVRIDSANADYYNTNLTAYLAKLDALDSLFKDVVSNATGDTVIFEGRFPFRYLFDEYSLNHFAAFNGCSSNTEVPLSTVNNLINSVKTLSKPAIFKIEFSAGTVAQSIADATGATVYRLQSAHNISSDDFNSGKTYIDIMTQNANTLKEALG